MIKKKKPTEQQIRTKTRKKAVALAKEIVKIKSGRKCEKCGADGRIKQMQGSHIYPEGRYQSMSADTDNILCLCAGCHMWSNDSWHENPLESAEWFHQKYPERYAELKKRSQVAIKMDWNAKLEVLKEELRALN